MLLTSSRASTPYEHKQKKKNPRNSQQTFKYKFNLTAILLKSQSFLPRPKWKENQIGNRNSDAWVSKEISQAF